MHTRTLRLGLLGATLLAGATGIAMAQPAPTYDPQQLPAFHGKVAQYDLTPRGDVDGLILDDGTEVHFPPHIGTQVVAAVKAGDTVTIHGLKARELKLIQAMSVTNDAGAATVIATGPGGRGHRRGGEHDREHEQGRGSHGGGTPMEVSGRVKMQLHGPRGDLNGVLLEDGTMVHMPPPEATRLAAQLTPGESVFVRGEGTASVLGKSLDARALGASADHLTPLAGPHHGHHEPAAADQPAAK